MVSIEELYHCYGILADAKEKAGEHVAAYKVIMSGTKSESSQKRLASQFITRFYRHFPELADESLEAMFDLCEDEDFSVIKQVVRDLPQICKDSAEYSQRAACVLLQLLSAVLPSEQSIISESLLNILKVHTRETLKHMFELMTSDDLELCRQAINFLHTKLKLILSYGQSMEIEETIVVNCKKVIDEVCDNECLLLIKTLKTLPSMATLTGRLHLLDVISQRLHLERPPFGNEEIKQALSFLMETDGLLSKNVPSTEFVKYICLHIIPLIIAQDCDEDLAIGFLHVLTEMVIFYDDGNSCEKCLDSVYSYINHLILCPVVNSEQDLNPSPESEVYTPEKLAQIECILFTFHQLCRFCPQYLVLSENLERLKSLRSRLQFVSRVAQIWKKRLQPKSENDSDQNKCTEIKMNNIISIVKDFFHNPPSFKTDVVLSFKASPSVEEAKSLISGTEKRKIVSPLPTENADNIEKKAKISNPTVARKEFYPAVNSSSRTGFKKQRLTQQVRHKPSQGAIAGVNVQSQLGNSRAAGHQGSRNTRHQQHRFPFRGQSQGHRYQTMPFGSTRGPVPQNNFVHNAYTYSSRPVWQNQRNKLNVTRIGFPGQFVGNTNNYCHLNRPANNFPGQFVGSTDNNCRLNRPVSDVIPPLLDFRQHSVAGGEGHQNWNGIGQRRVFLRNGSGKSEIHG